MYKKIYYINQYIELIIINIQYINHNQYIELIHFLNHD